MVILSGYPFDVDAVFFIVTYFLEVCLCIGPPPGIGSSVATHCGLGQNSQLCLLMRFGKRLERKSDQKVKV